MNENEKKWIDEHAADGERIDQAAQAQEDHDSMVESTVDRELFDDITQQHRDIVEAVRSPQATNFCPDSPNHKHVIDFHSVTNGAMDPRIIALTCEACGRSGAFRIPEVSEIDW